MAHALLIALGILLVGLLAFVFTYPFPRRRTPYTGAQVGSREAATALRHARQEEWTAGWRAPLHRAVATIATPFGRPGAHRQARGTSYYCPGCDHHITNGLAHDCRALDQLRKDTTP